MPIHVINLDAEGTDACFEALVRGKLVAIPTETVYGLGCDARNPKACKSVYELKGRPHTDPLIVHVATFEDACHVWDLGQSPRCPEKATVAKCILSHITDSFWPGPLTMIYDANAEYANSPVSAGTGLVGVRNPSHPTARHLLETSKIPIAAPSANRFGHTSPTSAMHVIDDFASKLAETGETLIVVTANTDIPCEVGIESTILRLNVHVDENVPSARIEILRKGVITQNDIAGLFRSDSSDRNSLFMEIHGQKVPIRVETVTKFITDTAEKQSGPGQLVKHYAPNIPTYVLTLPDALTVALQKGASVQSGDFLQVGEEAFFWIKLSVLEDFRMLPPNAQPSFTFGWNGQSFFSNGGHVTVIDSTIPLQPAHHIAPSTSIACIDYGGYFSTMQAIFRHRTELSQRRDPREAAQNIYAALRDSEYIDGATALFVPDLMAHCAVNSDNSADREIEASIADRLYRAASGTHVPLVWSFV